MTRLSDAAYYSDYSDTPSDDPRNCRVVGCRKKHAYARDSSGRKLYADYCAYHLCEKTFPRSEGFHCPNPKKENDRFCSQHLKCGEPNCKETGTFASETWTQFYCPRHKCTTRGCRQPATNRQQQRCASHFLQCSVPSCARPCHENRDGTYDIVCAAHYGSFKCAVAGCARRKPGYDTRFCLDHKCAVPECSQEKGLVGKFCVSHRCAARDCSRVVADPTRGESVLCKEHECATPRCLNAKLDSRTDFCLSHACKAANCKSEARFPGGFCEERHACSVGMCSNPRSATGPGGTLNVFTDRCLEHSAAKVRRSSANEPLERERWATRNRNRYSDDIETLRSRERERELKEWEEKERLARESYDPAYRYPGWDRWYTERGV